MKTIRSSLTIVLASIIMVVVLITLIYQYTTMRKTALEWAKDKSRSTVSLLSSEISTTLTGVSKDLFIIRDLPQLRQFLNSRDQVSRQLALTEMERFLLIFAEKMTVYDQIRFIDASGAEVVRVNFDGKKASAVSPPYFPLKRLQDKKSRYYFKETMKLNAGELFVSPMDLNIEYGRIEEPHKPMIRYATPVFDSKGLRRGIVILNFKAGCLLDIVKRHQKEEKHGESYYLLNRDGYYLYHPDSSRQWGFMLEKDDRIQNDLPEFMPYLKEQCSSSVFLKVSPSGKKMLFTHQKITPFVSQAQMISLPDHSSGPISECKNTADRPYWVLVSTVSEANIMPLFMKYRASMVLFFGLLLFGGVVIAYFLAWKISHPVQQLSNSAARIAGGDLSARVSVSSGNELGKLGKVFNDMAEALKKRQDQEKFFQRKLREEIVLAQERERKTLSQEIHDHIGQTLALLKMKIQGVKSKLPEDSMDITATLDENIELTNEMIRQTRTLIFDLYPIVLDDFGIIATIEWHTQQFAARTGISVTFEQTGNLIEPERSISVLILRVLKELLNNAFKHAETTNLQVLVLNTESAFELQVIDRGKGFNAVAYCRKTQDFRGIGLLSIRESITGIGGEFIVDSSPGNGTTVTVKIPIAILKKGETNAD